MVEPAEQRARPTQQHAIKPPPTSDVRDRPHKPFFDDRVYLHCSAQAGSKFPAEAFHIHPFPMLIVPLLLYGRGFRYGHVAWVLTIPITAILSAMIYLVMSRAGL